MPSLTFILPHWLYWSGLVVFPFVAIMLVRRERRRGPGHGINLFTAYLFWLTAGFLGMHRFYLKSLWGFLFIPFFLAILWGNGHIRDAREDVSRTHFQHERTLRAVERADSRVKAGRPGAAEAAATAREQEQQTKAALDVADGALSTWNHVTSGAAIALALLLLGDAALLPRAVRRAREREGDPRAEITVLPEAPMQGTVEATSAHVRTKFTDAIDGFNKSIGTYVAYWAVIAVFVYYYEVVARYVFNSPTNWVHESMFLMFGMQYLFCGAYAYREDSHVRVDVFYSKLSPRGKAMADIFTSLLLIASSANLHPVTSMVRTKMKKKTEVMMSAIALPRGENCA
jgi:TRAP-type C4-dicarboxylate transport system permease small subunit